MYTLPCGLSRCPFRGYTGGDYRITVNRKNKTLNLYKRNKIIRTYTIAVGKQSTPTPKGIFLIKNKAPNPGGPFGAMWMGLNIPGGGYGIHGTNDPSSIGKAVSHGCIRMYNSNILELSKLVPIGTIVRII